MQIIKQMVYIDKVNTRTSALRKKHRIAPGRVDFATASRFELEPRQTNPHSDGGRRCPELRINRSAWYPPR